MDFGAEATLISKAVWKRIGSPKLIPMDHTLVSLDGGILPCADKLKTKFNVLTKTGEADGEGCCFVTDGYNICGLPWLSQIPELKEVMDLVAADLDHMEVPRNMADQPKKSHADVFKEPLGCFAVKKVVPKLKDNAVPVFRKKKRTPFTAVSESGKEIDYLLAKGIVSGQKQADCTTVVKDVMSSSREDGEGDTAFWSV